MAVALEGRKRAGSCSPIRGHRYVRYVGAETEPTLARGAKPANDGPVRDGGAGKRRRVRRGIVARVSEVSVTCLPAKQGGLEAQPR